MDLESFKSLSLLDMVYLRIKEDILSGRYAAGERMVVSRLSEQLGVSHTPINEALNRLVMEGYVEFIPRKGMKVRELDMTEIAETYEIRKMVELYSADKVIARAKADPAFLPEIRRLERMVAEGGYEPVAEIGRRPGFRDPRDERGSDHRRFRKPLVVMSPKSLLRHPRAVSKPWACWVAARCRPSTARSRRCIRLSISRTTG